MLDEKIQDAEHSLVSVREESQEEKELIAGKVDELTTSLQNLKWGFKDRREFFFQLVFNTYIHTYNQLCVLLATPDNLLFSVSMIDSFLLREDSLTKQLQSHKKAVLYLFAAHKKLRGHLK